jgi:hypothetical protein
MANSPPHNRLFLFALSLMAVGLLIVGLQLSGSTPVSGAPVGTPTPKPGSVQGNSHSNPDGNGVDKPFGADGQSAMSQGPSFFDGNNGCGQDKHSGEPADQQGGWDDNNGNCVRPNALVATATSSANHIAVTICHHADDANLVSITVDDNAVQAHLQHGDTTGACPTSTAAVTSTVSGVGLATSTPTAAATMTPTTAAGTATSTTVAATATFTSIPSSTATGTPPTATGTPPTATGTPPTATSVPATATSGPLTVVTNTPETSSSIVSSAAVTNNSLAPSTDVATTNQAPTELTVVSGSQGGGNTTGTTGATGTTGQSQAVSNAAQGSGASNLPSTGNGGPGSGTNGMLYFGIGLIILGGALAGTKLMRARR